MKKILSLTLIASSFFLISCSASEESFDQDAPAPNPPRRDSQNKGNTTGALIEETVGQIEAFRDERDYDEFNQPGGTSALLTYKMNSKNLLNVQKWIGYNLCEDCEEGKLRRQRLQFEKAKVGQVYRLFIHPSFLRGSSVYSAFVVAGDAKIRSGDRHQFERLGWYPGEWVIEIEAQEEDFTIELSNFEASGQHYLYLNYLKLELGN